MSRIFRTLDEARSNSSPSVVTIGNFDGVHLGHRALLERTVSLAKKGGFRSVALTFNPHPVELLAPERAPRRICSLERRLELLSAAGVDGIFVLPFTSEIASMSAQTFLDDIVVGVLRARAVVVGDNFRFGHQQAGDPQFLGDYGAQHHVACHVVPAVSIRGEVASSSAIRRHIAAGEVGKAARLLGYCVSAQNTVVRGQGIGSKQTVPTINILPGEELLPAKGVYITECEDLDGGRRWHSITNVGERPTFQGQGITVETFLLSPFDGETPARVRISFRRWVREERAFPSAELLRAQILSDVRLANRYWRLVESRRLLPR